MKLVERFDEKQRTIFFLFSHKKCVAVTGTKVLCILYIEIFAQFFTTHYYWIKGCFDFICFLFFQPNFVLLNRILFISYQWTTSTSFVFIFLFQILFCALLCLSLHSFNGFKSQWMVIIHISSFNDLLCITFMALRFYILYYFNTYFVCDFFLIQVVIMCMDAYIYAQNNTIIHCHFLIWNTIHNIASIGIVSENWASECRTCVLIWYICFCILVAASKFRILL